MHRMIKWFGPIIDEYYSRTEGFAGTTSDPQEWLAHPGSVGKPFTAVHVVGDDGTERAVGESGEALFRGRTGVRVLRGSGEDRVGVQRSRLEIAA